VDCTIIKTGVIHMPEWQIIIDSDDFPDPSTEEEPPRRPRFHPRWLLVIGVIVALLLAGILSLFRQRAQGVTNLEQDLTAAIFEEETIRHFGDPAQSSDLIIPNARKKWQQSYANTFHNGIQSPPNTIEITDIQFNGECAVIDVKLDNDEKTRAYCLNDQQWKRAPISASVWGQEQASIGLENGITLRYWPRDREFTQSLAEDLNQLFDTLRQTGHQIDETQLPTEIVIQPIDMASPLIADNGPQIVLNSPLLVPITTVSGQADVRLSLAQTMLARMYSTNSAALGSDNFADLPGATRILEAIHTVMAAHVLLNSADQQQLVNTWRDQLDGQWGSPLYQQPLNPAADSFNQVVAARLMAEYIYQSNGMAGLVDLAEQLSTTNSWDTLFLSILNRSTADLEKEVIAFSAEKTITANPANTLPETPTQSLAATLTGYAGESSQPFASIALQDEPIWLDFSATPPVITADGASIPAYCIPPGTDFEISGEWLEFQRRFQVNSISLSQKIAPLTIPPSPDDTIAFLTTNQHLTALSQDGELHPLINLDASLQMAPLPIAADKPPHFLFSLDLPLCEHTWLVRYTTDKGITNTWLSPPAPTKWAWRVSENDPLFFKLENETGHTIYQTNNSLTPEVVSQTQIPITVLGWNQQAQQLVFQSPWMDFTNLGLIEPTTGNISKLQMHIKPIQMRELSPDGQWLIILPEPDNLFERPHQLSLFNMEDLTTNKFLEIMAEEGIGSTIWSLYLDQPQIAILFGPLYGDDAMRLQRLAIAVPDQPETLTTVVEAGTGEQLASPVFCSDGSLLYQVEKNSQFQLNRWNPDQASQTLLTLNQPFELMVCS
jgi:hypothetical protein